MDSSEATISTQDQFATAAVQALLHQQIALVRQDIRAEVTAQLRAVDSRISSVEESASQTQRDVSRLESQSREMYQELKEQSATMQTQAASKAQFEALMAAMATLTHSIQKDS